MIIFICCKEKFPKDFLFQLACMIPENTMQAAKARKQFNSPVQLWQRAAQKRGSKQRLHVGGNQLLSKWTLGPRDIREMVPPAGYFFSLPAGVRSEVTFPDLQNSLLHFKSCLYTTESVATLYQRHPCFFKPISYQLLGRVLRIWWVQKTFD